MAKKEETLLKRVITCNPTPSESRYDVLVGDLRLRNGNKGLRAFVQSLQEVAPLKRPEQGRYVILTDKNVRKFCLPSDEELAKAFVAEGLRTPLLRVMQPGEATKCRSAKAEIEDWMLNQVYSLVREEQRRPSLFPPPAAPPHRLELPNKTHTLLRHIDTPSH